METEKGPEQKEISLYDQIYERSRAELVKLFPEKEHEITSRQAWRIIDSFVADILGRNNVEAASIFHRIDSKKQTELLAKADKTIESLFTNLPDDFVDFYRKKLEAL